MISNSAIRTAIIKGIEKANRKHLKWAKNFWVSDYAAERLIQTEIAEAIFSAGEAYRKDDLAVFIEPNVSELYAAKDVESIEEETGINISKRDQWRVDVGTWMRDRGSKEDDWMPHLIEVKKNWGEGVKSDFVRCAEFMHILRDYSTEAAFSAFFIGSARPNSELFGLEDGDVEKYLEKLAREALEAADNGQILLAETKIKAEVGKKFRYKKNEAWSSGGVKDKTAKSLRWRAAVVQFT